MNNIQWRGKNIGYSNQGQKFCDARQRLGHNDICPLCNEKIANDVILIVSNQANMPNRILHEECFSKEEPEKIMDLLAERYEEAKQMAVSYKQNYAHWFE